MISFNCEKCGKTFKVPESFAGRTAKCKICGNMVTVPTLAVVPEPLPEPLPEILHESIPEQIPEPVPEQLAEPVPEPLPEVPAPVEAARPPAPIKIPMRTRRLRADAAAMSTAFADSETITVTPLAGEPPESYRIKYNIESLQPGPDGKPIPRSEHEVEIQLTSDYPRLSPSCKILTPIFHPNFDHSTICVGDHWTAGERLVDLIIRIGEMIAYQAYNIQSPLDGSAAMWADLNRGLLPTDLRNLQPAEVE